MSDVVFVTNPEDSTVIETEVAPEVLLTSSEGVVSSITTEGKEVVIVTTQESEKTVIESVSIGPQGIPGVQGEKGEPGSALAISGNNSGDFFRWNALTDTWEVKSEPLELKQLVLTPSEAALLDKEGSLWYSELNKVIFVCTEND